MPKNSAARQLARRLAIINILPCLPETGTVQGMTAGQVMARLETTHQVDRRTFERDLEQLGDPAGEWRRLGVEVTARVSATDARANEWFTTAASRIPLFRSVTPADALVASFASQELGPFLPGKVRDTLAEQIAMVEGRLRHLQLTAGYREVTAYRDRIRRLPDGNPMTPARVVPAHLQTVNDALMKNLMLRLTYRAARHGEPGHYLVCPVGLVIHDRSMRLLAVPDTGLGPDPSVMTVKSYMLHRMLEVTAAGPVDRNVMVPTLDGAIAAGALSMWSKGQIALHLRFAGGEDAAVFARTLEEMLLARDQKIGPNGRGQLELTATVTNTSALRRLLQSMAKEVRVLVPDDLKRDIRDFLAAGLAFQQQD
jgi:hypothetical protein